MEMEQLLNFETENQVEPTPNYWPLFYTDAQTMDEESFHYIGYVKKMAPGILKVTDLNEDESIFFDKTGTLEKALQLDTEGIIRKIITH